MPKIKLLALWVMPTIVAMSLTACGGDSKTTSTTDPVATLPTVSSPTEVVTAGDKQVVINVIDTSSISSSSSKSSKSTSSTHANWNLYLWNDTTCSALDSTDSSIDVGSWDKVDNMATGEDTYGPYWTLPVTSDSGCVNFILRNGTDKLISSDMKVDFSAFPDRTVTVVPGKSTV